MTSVNTTPTDHTSSTVRSKRAATLVRLFSFESSPQPPPARAARFDFSHVEHLSRCPSPVVNAR